MLDPSRRTYALAGGELTHCAQRRVSDAALGRITEFQIIFWCETEVGGGVIRFSVGVGLQGDVLSSLDGLHSDAGMINWACRTVDYIHETTYKRCPFGRRENAYCVTDRPGKTVLDNLCRTPYNQRSVVNQLINWNGPKMQELRRLHVQGEYDRSRAGSALCGGVLWSPDCAGA